MIDTALAPASATARSSLPSLLKSPAIIEAVGYRDVEVAVAVEVPKRNGARILTDRKYVRRSEIPQAITKHQVHRVVARGRDQQIEIAVVVEITGRNRQRIITGHKIDRGRKVAEAVAD